MFSSKDCLIGQYPGIRHDVSHLYTSGSGCPWERAKSKPVFLGGGWESAVAGGGLVPGARISLMEGVLRSKLWQPDRSW